MERYRAAALAHGEATEAGDHRRANKAHQQLVEALRAVRATGDAAGALGKLMDDPELAVRVWAATHGLEFDPDAAERVLSGIASGGHTIHQFNAEMVLREWRAGRLTFPQ